MQASISDTVLVRSKPSSDAVVRLISGPLIKGLQDSGQCATIVSPEAYMAGDALPAIVVFHYDDRLALNAIKSRSRPNLVACLGVDIYEFGIYLRAQEIADVFFAPTEAHCALLRSQLTKPVYLLPEAIDETFAPSKRSRAPGRSVCWFGYPESFGKAMTSLMPVIEHCLQTNVIDRFALITDVALSAECRTMEILPYSVDTFADILNQFDYTILSHFALDLHINSLIKSPNKLLTAIYLGLIPLASATPSYSALLRTYGLDRFLFDSPGALLDRLGNLDAERDARDIDESQMRAGIIREFSPLKTGEAFMSGLAKLRALDHNAATHIQPRCWTPAAQAEAKRPRRSLLRALTRRTDSRA